MFSRDKLLQTAEHRETASRLADLAEAALRTWELAVGDFLSPPEIAEVDRLFGPLAELDSFLWGGYPQAERKRVAFARSDLGLTAEAIPIAYLDIAGNFLFDPASHRDFLGALLGTGIVRDKVGDLVVLGERGAQAIVVPDLVPFLETHLVQVRSVPVKTRAIEREALKVREPKRKEITTVEASMRLDAVASAGFGMSRGKMVDAINAGDVRVNWKDIKTPSHPLESGDLVAIRGKGRLEIGEVAVTKKSRYRIQLVRLV